MANPLEDAAPTIELLIHTQDCPAPELLTWFESHCQQPEVRFELRRRQNTFRTLDATVLIAIITGAGVLTREVVKAAFDYAAQRHKQTITIKETSHGVTVELTIPIGATDEEIDRVMSRCRQMQRPQIEI